MKKFVSLLLVLSMLVTLCFSAVAEGIATQRYPKVTIAVESDPQDLIPYNINGGSKPFIYQNFYETLFDLVNNDYEPVLAVNYKVIDDTHWQVKLYDYIYDTAGNHITADDVVFCTNWLVDSGYAFRYDIFSSIAKVDDYTVEYTWSRPVTGVGELEFPWCRTVIFSQKAFEQGNFATAPVSTGHYYVKEFTSGSKVLLEANDKYWQKPELVSERHQANVQTIEYDVITESSQHVIGLETGALQYSERVPNENLAEFDQGGQYSNKFKVGVSAGSMLYMLTTNQLEGKPCNDYNLRMAIYYAINNDACATVTGSTVPCKAFGTTHFSDYVKAWDETPNYINTYDPELAKQYLAKSSYKGETLTLLGGNDEVYTNLLTIIQSFLLNVGINTEIKAIDTANVGNSAADETLFDIIVVTLGGGSQIGEWNRVLNYNELGIDKSYGFIHDETLQQLFTTAASIEGHTDANMTALQNYILEKGYHYAIVTPKINAVYSNCFATLVYRENEFLLPGACTYNF